MRQTPPRSIPTRRARRPFAALLAAALLPACTTLREPFPGEDAGRLWTAMVAAAVTPDYTEANPKRAWEVKENQVWVDASRARLEVYRELVRVTDRTSTEPTRVNRDSRFRILLDTEEEPPSIVFISRGAGVPKHATIEALRYFDDVRTVLGLAVDIHSDEGGAATPEAAARELVRSMFMQDETAIRRLVLPAPDMEVLWEAEPADVLPPQARWRLRQRGFRAARVGETVIIDGEAVEVTADMITGDRRLMLASVGGEALAPFYAVRLGGRWWVEAEPIVKRRRLEMQRRRWEEY